MTSIDKDTRRSVGEEELKRRFSKAWEIDPHLRPSEFYTLLEKSNFNTHAAYQSVTQRVKTPTSFLVPADVLDRSSPPSDPTPDPLNIVVIDDDSESEDLLEVHRRAQKRKKNFTSRVTTQPSTVSLRSGPPQKFGSDNDPILNSEFRNSHLSTAFESSDEEDTRPRKRTSPSKLRSVLRKTTHRPIEYSDEEDDGVDDFPSPASSTLTQRSANLLISSTLSPTSWQGPPESSVGFANEEINSDEEEISSDQSSETTDDDSSLPDLDQLFSSPIPLRPKKVLKKPVRPSKNLDDEVLKNRTETKTTRWIRTLAGSRFNRSLEAAEADPLDPEENETLIYLTSGKGSLPHQTWDDTPMKDFSFLGDPTRRDRELGRDFYSAVKINGKTYREGEFCLVRPDDQHAELQFSKKRKEDPDAYHGNGIEAWFARIVSLYHDDIDGEGCHLQWFIHGSQTLLEETAGSWEIFDNSICDDNPLGCIVNPVKVNFVGNSKADYYSAIVETKYTGNEYFYRFNYDSSKKSFTHAKAPVDQSLLNQYCACCEKSREKKRYLQPRTIGKVEYDGGITAFEKEGVKYFVKGFVYIIPAKGARYEIGQILSMRALKRRRTSNKEDNREIRVTVQLFGRYDDSCQQWWYEVRNHQKYAVRDNRHLYLSDSDDEVLAERIEGKCQVRHIEHIDNLSAYKDERDTFWVDVRKSANASGRHEFSRLSAKEIQYSKETQRELAERKKILEEFHASNKPVRVLELFAGAGGLGLGLQESGATVTDAAVEFAPAPARTLKHNSPHVQVYNEDVNSFLERAMAEDKGLGTSGYKDIEGNPVSAPTPKRGHVCMIAGGFPCPGYSGCNHHQLYDDIKNTLIATGLGAVDFFRPEYFLLENVVGLLRHKLGAKQGKNKLEGGIERGTLKFIFRALTSLGYACQFTTLQSGEYGIPQSRQRVFIWGSLGELPKYPQPTTTWEGRYTTSFHRTSFFAPHNQVTVGQAFTDLTAFEWCNPHNVIKRSRDEKIDRLERSARIKQIAVVPGMKYVGSEVQAYASPPLSEFQRKLRRFVKDGQLRNHVTLAYQDNPTIVKGKYIRHARTEQVCNIPMQPGADHRDLPRELKNWGLAAAESAALRNKNYPGRYGRLDMDGVLQICLTKADPGGKSGRVLHPTQYRIISVREYARAMGYPDHFVFEDENPQLAYRMIGNSVPVILAEEIGRELLELRVRQFIQKKANLPKNIDIEVIDLISDDES